MERPDEAIKPPKPPKLLVSLKDAEEAKLACEAGVDILDAKDPENGSLGRVAASQLQSILHCVHHHYSHSITRPKTSCALGEWVDLAPDEAISFLNQSIAGPSKTQSKLDFVKVGLSQTETAPSTRWQRGWLDLRERLKPFAELVIVAYADWNRCNAPPVDQIIKFAIANRCTTMLIDTFFKDGNRLLDYFTIERLQNLRELANAHGLVLCIAGSIKQDCLEPILKINPDVIAVRGAVCENTTRTCRICKTALSKFKNSLVLASTER